MSFEPIMQLETEVPAVHDYGVAAVASAGALFSDLLARAGEVKSATSVEPPLEKSHFVDLHDKVSSVFAGGPLAESADDTDPKAARKTRRYAVLETAVRDLFGNLIASIPIESPAFVQVWNLLDILTMLSDDEKCDPPLLFWLVEELLESQTIAGCRKIFDFLESRRERITAKHFDAKKYIILRSCNELLRRLSRAEDTGFCGRVFIFMFQSFPLGDKSSVNPRGEYHVENVTIFDRGGDNPHDDKMDTEEKTADGSNANSGGIPPKPGAAPAAAKKQQPEHLDPEKLYPIFWALQESFSQPKKLFDAAHFARFKAGMEATMATFKVIQRQQEPRQARHAEESRRGMKRKLGDRDGNDANMVFNPKYLTSRDLFGLEIGDLSFRRYVLVQALIIVEFVLSLSAKAKEKVASLHNKSVIYPEQILSEEDTKWAASMKRSIAEYLKQGLEGPYFYRMVETVLSRDKNWVRWKMENCPPIELPALGPDAFLDAKKSVQRNTTNKRLRPTQPLDFLNSVDEDAALEKFAAKERYMLPELATFRGMIADSDFDIDRAGDAKAKAAAAERKASKAWRALRIASMSRLASFDKIDDANNIDAVFEERSAVSGDADAAADGEDEDSSTADFPSDCTPIILAGCTGAGKTSVADLLMKRRKGVFIRVARHTTRKPAEGEVDGRHFTFVSRQDFDIMRDGDRFFEHGSLGDYDYATSSATVDAIAKKGKVPLLELSCQAALNASDVRFASRIFLIMPPSRDALESRLKAGGTASDAAVAGALNAFDADQGATPSPDVFEAVVTNDDVEATSKQVEELIYKSGPATAFAADAVEMDGADQDGAETKSNVTSEVGDDKPGEQQQDVVME